MTLQHKWRCEKTNCRGKKNWESRGLNWDLLPSTNSVSFMFSPKVVEATWSECTKMGEWKWIFLFHLEGLFGSMHGWGQKADKSKRSEGRHCISCAVLGRCFKKGNGCLRWKSFQEITKDIANWNTKRWEKGEISSDGHMLKLVEGWSVEHGDWWDEVKWNAIHCSNRREIAWEQ